MQPAVILMVLLILAGVGYLVWRQDQERRKALLEWAQGRGWQMLPAGRKDLTRQYPGLPVFDKGHSRQGKNFVRGEWEGREVTCLDYVYVTGHGKNRATHRRGVVILACGFPTVPLTIRRENPLDRVGEFLGAGDIDFESAEFNRQFFVKSPDRKWAFDIIHPRAMEYLMQAPHYAIEFGFGEIAVHRRGYNSPARHEEALALAQGFYRLIPEYVIRQMKGGQA